MLRFVHAGTKRVHCVAGQHGNRLARDHRTCVHTLVDVVHGRGRRRSARGKQVLQRMSTREVGQRRRMNVHDAAREAVEEHRTQEVHVAGADHELDATLREPVRHRPITTIAVVEVVEREGLRGDSGGLGSLERAHSRLVGRDRDNRKLSIEERLEIRPLTRDQDPDHARTTVPITSASPGSGATAT